MSQRRGSLSLKLRPQQGPNLGGKKTEKRTREAKRNVASNRKNCFICNKATKSEHAFFLNIFIIAHGLSAIQRFFCLYNYSQQRTNVTPQWNWLIPNRCRSKAKIKLKGLFAWSEVKWNKKSSAPKRPSLFARTSYLVPTEGDGHACLCKDCVVCGLTMFTLHCVNVHVVAKVTFACSMLVSSHLKKSQSVRRHGLVHGLATFEKETHVHMLMRHIGANASLACIMPNHGIYISAGGPGQLWNFVPQQHRLLSLCVNGWSVSINGGRKEDILEVCHIWERCVIRKFVCKVCSSMWKR